MKEMRVGYNLGCTMGFLMGHSAWQIDQFPTCWPMNGLFVHWSRGWGVSSFSERLVNEFQPTDYTKLIHWVVHKMSNIFKHILLNENFYILIKILLKFIVPKGPIYSKSALIHVMASCWIGGKKYYKISNIRCTKSPNLNVSRLVL